jgi:hypothetical protein
MLLRRFRARAEACATVATARATLRLADGRPNAYPEETGTEFHIAERWSGRGRVAPMPNHHG